MVKGLKIRLFCEIKEKGITKKYEKTNRTGWVKTQYLPVIKVIACLLYRLLCLTASLFNFFILRLSVVHRVWKMNRFRYKCNKAFSYFAYLPRSHYFFFFSLSLSHFFCRLKEKTYSKSKKCI